MQMQKESYLIFNHSINYFLSISFHSFIPSLIHSFIHTLFIQEQNSSICDIHCHSQRRGAGDVLLQLRNVGTGSGAVRLGSRAARQRSRSVRDTVSQAEIGMFDTYNWENWSSLHIYDKYHLRRLQSIYAFRENVRQLNVLMEMQNIKRVRLQTIHSNWVKKGTKFN